MSPWPGGHLQRCRQPGKGDRGAAASARGPHDARAKCKRMPAGIGFRHRRSLGYSQQEREERRSRAQRAGSAPLRAGFRVAPTPTESMQTTLKAKQESRHQHNSRRRRSQRKSQRTTPSLGCRRTLPASGWRRPPCTTCFAAAPRPAPPAGLRLGRCGAGEVSRASSDGVGHVSRGSGHKPHASASACRTPRRLRRRRALGRPSPSPPPSREPIRRGLPLTAVCLTKIGLGVGGG